MIDRTGELFLRACAQRGVDFSRTLMLGRQQLLDFSFAESFFRELGARSVDSLDASTFEGATIIADLNKPLPDDLRRRFSVVFDGGTLEHVFDIATALRSCLDLVELGGHYITIAPANNWPGHGFYQLSPELFFRSLSAESGYEMRATFVAELRKPQRWYAVSDPAVTGARLYWRNGFRTFFVAAARRTAMVDLSDFAPQQSDYETRWESHARAAGSDAQPGVTNRTKRFIKRVSPSGLLDAYTLFRQRRDEGLHPPRFTRVEIGDLAAKIR